MFANYYQEMKPFMRCMMLRFAVQKLSLLLIAIQCLPASGYCQTDSLEKRIAFPAPMNRLWQSSIGFSFLTTPEAITEEVRLRVPAGELIVLRKINDRFNLSGRLTFQILQNHIALGARMVHQLSDRVYFSVGDEIGYWFGFLNVGGFDSKAHGWMNYLNASLGIRLKNNLLLTFKGEGSFNLAFTSKNGDNEISSDKNFYNGEAFTVALEQPFFHKKHITLSISGISNYFYWQTWSLFYLVDRRIFYPQFKVGFML